MKHWLSCRRLSAPRGGARLCGRRCDSHLEWLRRTGVNTNHRQAENRVRKSQRDTSATQRYASLFGGRHPVGWLVWVQRWLGCRGKSVGIYGHVGVCVSGHCWCLCASDFVCLQCLLSLSLSLARSLARSLALSLSLALARSLSLALSLTHPHTHSVRTSLPVHQESRG